MKKLLSPILLFIPIFLHAQIESSLGLGADTYKHFLYTLSLGYNSSHLEFTGEIRPSMTRSVSTNNYMGIKAGYDLFSIMQQHFSASHLKTEFGYYFDAVSSDKTQLNKWVPAIGIKYVKDITYTGSLPIELLYINHSLQFTIGMQVNFK